MGNQLIAFPVQNTVEEMLKIMGGCPFDYLNPSLWIATMFVADKAIESELLNPGYVYRVNPISAELWYDDTIGKTDLLVILQSEDINRRVDILNQQGYVSAYPNLFLPYMVVVRGFPALTRANKTFVRSITMSLRSTPHNFMFAGETAVDSGGIILHQDGMSHFAERLLQ